MHISSRCAVPGGWYGGICEKVAVGEPAIIPLVAARVFLAGNTPVYSAIPVHRMKVAQPPQKLAYKQNLSADLLKIGAEYLH